MSLQTRRRFLGSGLAAGVGALAGCGSLPKEGCRAERTRHESDVVLAESASWPTYQYDAANTGHNPDASGPSGEPAVAWRANLCAGSTGAVVHDTRAYVGGFVFDGRAGEPVGGDLHGHMRTPTVADGTLYVSAHDLEARDATTGEHLWTFETDIDVGAIPAPRVADGTVYVPGGEADEPTLYAVDAAEGTERWRFGPADSVERPAAVDAGTVYVVDTSDAVYAVDAETGEERWRTSVDVRIWQSPPVVDGETLYVGSLDGEVFAFRTADGSEVWRRRVDPDFAVDGAVAVADGAVFAPGKSGTIAALDAANGDVRWHVSPGAYGLGNPAVADGVVYVGAVSSNPLFALDAATGDERWRFETRADRSSDAPSLGIVGAPAVVGEFVYAATAAGDLYAITGAE